MTQVFGHRGASAHHPENTIAAFAGAIDAGAHGVELDVRLAADGSVVVHHDAHLADGRAIIELDRAALPESVPDLAEVLDLCASITVNIEIKSDRKDPDFDETYAISHAVVDLVNAAKADERVIITSFDKDAVDCLGESGLSKSKLRTGYISMLPPSWSGLVDRGHTDFNPWFGLVTKKMVANAHNRGLSIGAWTVNEAIQVEVMVDAGVDTIITDDPAMVLGLLNE